MTTHNITPIGRVNYRNDNRVFHIKQKDRLMHTFCIGKSGSGKSTLLQNMAISDAENGNGFCVIDPHGDLVESLLDFISPDRNVVYFNPADPDFPITFNPLRNVHPESYELTVSGLLSMFQNIWSDNWGPRLAHILRYSLLTLIEYGKASLLDIHPLLTDPSYRAGILSYIEDEKIHAFWANEFNQYSKSFRAEAISPILNKLGIFSTSSILRNTVGQNAKGLDFHKIMDEGKILLVNVSKGKLGSDVCALLGSMIVTSIQLSAFQRVSQPEHLRRPFHLYIDEFGVFTSLVFASLLPEIRKYAVSVFLCTQFLDQIRHEVRSAIMGNVGTMICLRIGGPDSEIMAKEFAPIFNEIDLINLPRYCMYLKLMIDGTTSQPFSATSLPLPERRESFKQEIISASQTRYGKPVTEILKDAKKQTKENPPEVQTLFSI